jgi:hypothetical protein
VIKQVPSVKPDEFETLLAKSYLQYLDIIIGECYRKASE